LLIDSGAYTAWRQDQEIDVMDYIAFIRTIPRDWAVSCIQLDVIGNPVQTKANWMRMLDSDVDALPVFTRGGNIDDLDAFYEHASLVMFGGIVSGAGNKNYIRWFEHHNQGRPVHWLGFSDVNFMRYYKPFSVDSSSVNVTERYGEFQYYAGGGRMKHQRRDNRNQEPPPEMIASCLRVGFTRREIKRLQNKAIWKGGATINSWKDGVGLAGQMAQIHRLYGSMDLEAHIGTQYYQALAAPNKIMTMFAAYDFLLERGRLVHHSRRTV
jgi:hypothetical protein